MNSGVHVSFGTIVFFGFMPRIGIAGSYCSSILEIWVDLENVIECHTEREKQISNTKAYMWNLEKWYRFNLFVKQDRDTGRKKHMDTKGGRKGWNKLGDWNWFIYIHIYTLLCIRLGFPGGSVVKKKKKKNPPTNTEKMGSIPGSGRSPGEGNGNPFQ